MEPLIGLLCIFLIAVLVVMPIWTISKLSSHGNDLHALWDRIRDQDVIIAELRHLLRSRPDAAPQKAPTPEAPAPTAVPAAPRVAAPEAAAKPLIAAEPPPIVEVPKPVIPAPVRQVPETFVASEPPTFARPREDHPAQGQESRPPVPAINWEQFMGAKLFAWLGGLALFLGVAFFVKYSFEHNLIPPEVRVAIGFLIGVGLIIGGLKVSLEKYRVTAQTLVASGVVSLYAVTFACNSIYHFAYFGPLPTFLLMVLITATAFILAVRLNAQVVAILGMLGGFLTPVLISTGHDNPAGLFGYIAILVVGLVSVALHRKWYYLVPMGAAGTVLMLMVWALNFYTPEKMGTAMIVCLGFCALFLGAAEAARRMGRDTLWFTRTAIILTAVAFGFAFFFLQYPAAGAHTGSFFTFVLLTSMIVFAIAWRENLGWLVPGAAGASALLMAQWTAKMYTPEQAHVVVGVCLGFSVLYFVVYLVARRLDRASLEVLYSAVGMPGISLAFALFLVAHAPMGPGLLLVFMFASDALLFAIAWLDERISRLHFASGMAVFALLAIWIAGNLTSALLPWALGGCLVFAALHTAFPIVLQKRRPDCAPTWWNQVFPPLTLVLMLLPLFKLEPVSFLIWPAILLVDLIAIAVAVLSASLIAVAAVLVLTLLATGVTVFQVPAGALFDPSLLLVIGMFALLFFVAGLWMARKLKGRLTGLDTDLGRIVGDPQGQIPLLSALLPFVLLIMVCARLSVPDPSPVFGLGLLLVVLTLGLAKLLEAQWLPACALVGMASLEAVWHANHFDAKSPGTPLAWYIGFYAAFAAYAFIFRQTFAKKTGPWAVAALSGVAHFWMVFQAVKAGWPNDIMGIVPALFALAPLGSLILVLQNGEEDGPARLNQIAWFGGVTLFFITLVFPIQFDRQWLTVAWALEGAALIWLFHRIPHPGLRATGFALLCTVFVRLALNPAILEYHVRGELAVINWYLYTYGIAIAALFAGSRLLSPPRQMILGSNAQPITYAMGVILSFILLNIEIADFFTPPGAASLVFQFSGNFARDMSYTIGWALFALGLLSAGIWRQLKSVRYAAIALLSAALLKLFFHDLAQLEALYRVGALFAVAVIAILASFAYQRFLPANAKATPPQL
ncbi:MAG: DUF2339 domain-containing protein [Opitutaceae bacterium]